MLAESVPARRSTPMVVTHLSLVGPAIGLALVALAFRPVGPAGVGVTVAAGLIGLTVPTPRPGSQRAGLRMWIIVTVIGLVAFSIARTSVAGDPSWSLPVWGAVVTVLAGVGEEALFRRLLYGWLARWGPIMAIVVSAVLFALIHLPGYGVGVFGVDLAAGVLFGWQRWASGTWSAPAATHATANLLHLL